MSRSVVARVAMSRSAALSNMCSMISYRNGPVQEKRPAGAGLFALLDWSPEVVVAYLLGWVVGYVGRLWSVTLAIGSGRPAAALPADSALARLTGRELATDNPYRTPSRTRPASPAREHRGTFGRRSPCRHGKEGRRKATPKAKPAPVPTPSLPRLPTPT